MIESDLKKGMYLVNEGKTDLPLYKGITTTGTPFIYIKPGQIIGQIVDFNNSPTGVTVAFTSEQITDKGNIVDKFMNTAGWFLSFGMIHVYSASAKFQDLKKVISDKQIQAQKNAMNIAAANGVSLQNSITSLAKGAGEIVSEAGTSIIPWKLVGIGAGAYVLINWNKFFKPKTL